jgi:transposase
MRHRQNYSPDFREEAVKLLLDKGLSLQEAASRLGVPKNTLNGWVRNFRRKLAEIAAGGSTVSDLEREVRQLRKELAKARMERDILKKATAYFANALLPGTPSSKGSNSTSW